MDFDCKVRETIQFYDVNLEISEQPEKVESGITSGIFTACHIALVGDGLSKQPMIGFGFEKQA